MMRCTATLAVLVLLSGGSVASAQESEAGAGKLEMGFFPGGGMIFVGGDDNLEVNFNTYDAGGWVTFHLNRLIAVEGEGSFGIGLAQDINYQNRIVKHVQTPGTMNVAGNIVVFPAGSDRLYAGYVTGGAGLLNLRSRKSTRQFVSWSEPMPMVASTVAVKLDGNWMPSRTVREKPSRVNVTV